MNVSRPTLNLLTRISLAVIATVLSGCSPQGVRYKMTNYSPARDSIVDAYADFVEETFETTSEIVSMDRLRHGHPPTLDTTPAPKQQDALLTRYDSMYFKVYKVDVVDQYNVPHDGDNLAAGAATDAIHSWTNRLRPTGGADKLQVIIKDASLTPSGENNDKRYNARIEIEMRITRRDGTQLASISSTASQSALINAKTGSTEQKALLDQMLMKLIDSANGELEQQMAKLATYIDTSKAA